MVIKEGAHVTLQSSPGGGRGPFSSNHVGGTLLGGAIGHNVSVDRARQRDDASLRSYERSDVRAGRKYMTRTPYDPGERLRVRVDVMPTEG